MSEFSEQWEDEWRQRDNYPEWPWTDLVSAIHRHTNLEPGDKVLELGCGAGANVPFLLDLGVEYYAIEGAESAVETVHERFPSIKDTVVVGDFTETIPFDEQFDCVVDRGALVANTTEAIESGLALTHDVLRDDGVILTIDMYSTDHSEYKQKEGECVDEFTRTEFDEGPFSGLGEVHFCSESHLRDLYSREYEIEFLEHKVKTQVYPETGDRHAAWDVVARKS
jgi:cyclopropane fatty-acyl-phospholipid synthase-like methyltransferase